MKKEINSKLAIIFLIIIAVFLGGYIIFQFKEIPFPSWHLLIQKIKDKIFPKSQLEEIEKFSSKEDFKSYLISSQQALYFPSFAFGSLRGGAMRIELEETSPLSPPLAFKEKITEELPVPERVSKTTVQVLGIDEPDIIKTDGKEIYFSSGKSYYWQPFFGREYIPPIEKGEIKIIKAFPPKDLKIENKIDKKGDLLLFKNILIIFSGKDIFGYDISNPSSPQKKWEIDLEDYLVGARLYKEKIYLIVGKRINIYNPCPIRPFIVEGNPLEIKCTDIYHPVFPVSTDTVYNVALLDPLSGKIEKTISFTGSSTGSIIYMSRKGIYITYSYFESLIKFLTEFFKEKCKDLIPNYIIQKLERLESYEISEEAKFVEFQFIMNQYFSSLDEDERTRVENEIENRMADFYKDHKRELEKTAIVKINVDKFEISKTGKVPGIPLNQFSLDEYEGSLRIATTIGRNFGDESSNDVYVLNENLKIIGSIKDLGVGERIYSVRFIEDKGYVVTFREIDPFFVINLSNPKNPKLEGELKIPGYSSYLHPITKDKILGIGKEGWKVKISLFDVKDPKNPKEVDKYILKESYSDVLQTHHAFLIDKKHEIFFLPALKGGYIFSYKEGKLELKKVIGEVKAKRAIYIDDFLYIVGENKIVILNELNWERVNELKF